jgi:hypothetical protein
MLAVEDHDEHVRGTNAIELDSLCSDLGALCGLAVTRLPGPY